MKRYNETDLEKVLSGNVLYMAIEKSSSEQLMRMAWRAVQPMSEMMICRQRSPQDEKLRVL